MTQIKIQQNENHFNEVHRKREPIDSNTKPILNSLSRKTNNLYKKNWLKVGFEFFLLILSATEDSLELTLISQN